MKILSSLCEETLSMMKDDKIVICDYIMTPGGAVLLSEPISSSNYSCLFCNGLSHYCPYFDPSKSDKRIWLCANVLCEVYKSKSRCETIHTTTVPKRAVEWPLFCELNGIGDLHHNVKFELIDQSKDRLEYLFKFGTKPCGIVFMQGNAGSGKTFACLGVCEFFTRKNTSAIFRTQKQILNEWLKTFNPEKPTNFIEKVMTCNLLIIDDFGTGEISPGFMSFFMDLINTRMQWSDRGTIITTNLDDDTFSDYCGLALNDRISTGQKFKFINQSRRKPNIL